jgi:PIN domain nuclease of toxin-antitoxin system
MIFLDTHVLVWLYAGSPEPFSERAKRELQNGDLVLSPMILLELQYLYEAKKITEKGDTILAALQSTMSLRVMEDDWEETIRTALNLQWTRDPFDRIIVAQAMHHKAKLLTKDQQILKQYKGAVW